MAEINKDNDSANNNLIDFTAIKLKQLAKHYKDLGQHSIAKQVEDCYIAHMSGNIKVIWKEGLPYAKTISGSKEPTKHAE